MLLETLITESNELISATEDMYYENLAKTLNNSVLQAYKKIPIIPPPLIDNKFVTDTQTEAYIFNKFLVEQCTPLRNDSMLPTNVFSLIKATFFRLERGRNP